MTSSTHERTLIGSTPRGGAGGRFVTATSRSCSGSSRRADMLAGAYHEHRQTMHAVAREICGPELAADVVQDAFLRVLREDKFDPSRSSIRTYLLTVTRSVAIDYVRRDSAARARDDRHARSTLRRTEVDDATAAVLDTEAREQVAAAINRLSPRERELIVIAFHERLTYREIAVRLNMPEGTVKSRIRLALLKLRFHLSEYYARPATASVSAGDEHEAHRPSSAE